MMDVETKSLLRSAKLVSQVLLWICVFLVAVALGLLIWLIMDLPQTGQSLAASVGYGDDALKDWQAYALGTIVMVQIGIWGAVVWQGRQIFIALTAGAVQTASRAARKSARLLWIMLIWGIAAHALGTVIATWHFPEGQRALGVTLGSAEISTLFAALLATFTSHAFVLGAALWEDHQEVI